MSFNFGAPAAKPAATGFSFGSTATAPAQQQAAPPAFGGFGSAATTAAVKPTGFGAPLTATAVVAPTGFGAPAAAQPAASTGFGGFGAPAAAQPATSTGFGGFGATATAAPAASTGFGGFGATAPAASTGFGAATAPAAGGFGGFGAATKPATTAATGFGGFGAAPAATSAASTGLGGFGAAPVANLAPTGLGGFGAATGGVPTQLSTATTTTAALGLGGNTVAPSFSFGGVSAAGGTNTTTSNNQAGGGQGVDQKAESKNAKDQMIPAQLDATVEQLKKHIKDEKSVCSDVSHASDKTFTKIKQETEALSQLVTVLSIGIQKNRSALEKLKLSSAQELLNVEICQRTKDIPASMQYENTAPMEYFVMLVTQFEADMTEYRKQIDQTQHQLQLVGSGDAVSSEDISQAMRRLHIIFTDLAARYQVIHETLAKCKEQYINIYRRVHGTSVPGFNKPGIRPVVASIPSLAKLAGPSPFSQPSDPLIQARQIVTTMGQQTQGNVMGPPTNSLNITGTPAGAFGSLGMGAGGQANNTSFGGGIGGNTSMFGGGNTSFGGFGGNPANKTGFGGVNTNTSAFGGGNMTSFGGTTTGGFGGNTSAFGGNTTAFGGGNTTAFGGGNTSFGSPGFSSTGVFGSPTFGSPSAGIKRNKI